MKLPTKSRTYVREPEPEWAEYAELQDLLRPAKGIFGRAAVMGLIWAATIWILVRRVL